MKIDYAKGIEAISKEYNLLPISRWNFYKYGNLGWQLTQTNDAEVLEQASKVTCFMDIYESSFDCPDLNF